MTFVYRNSAASVSVQKKEKGEGIRASVLDNGSVDD